MSHEIESAVFMASQGAGWTGLGLAIPTNISRDPAKIAELCNATWTVEPKPVYYRITDANGRPAYVQAKGFSAQTRSDSHACLSITSANRYHTANRQPIDVFEAFRDELAREGLEISHAAVLRGGSVIAVSAILPADFDIVVGRNDRTRTYTTLSTGYAGEGSICTKGNIRVVCANTLAASIAEAKQSGKIKTVRASTLMQWDTLAKMVANAREMCKEQFAVFNAMANRQMSTHEVARYFADVLEINIADLNKVDPKTNKDLVSTRAKNMLTSLTEAYTKAPGADMAHGTAWGALHAVTYYATHEKGIRDTKGDGGDCARAASNMFGDAGALKARALALVQERMAVAA